VTTTDLPGSDAARHGTGDVDLTIMIASHDAFRRDLVKLARRATRRNLRDTARRLAITNGWDVFKRQLLQHHRAEDASLWPLLRQRLASSAAAMSTLDAMEHEHSLIDPLLAAVDQAVADHRVTDGRLGDVVGEFASQLTHHLGHEERDTLPLIGQTLTIQEWAGVIAGIRATGSADDAAQMIPWMLDEAPAAKAATILAAFPPVARVLYAGQWKPAYDAEPHW
jgi:iron-sulfur cluster repair protein YtfE (RIC family)